MDESSKEYSIWKDGQFIQCLWLTETEKEEKIRQGYEVLLRYDD